MIKPPESTEFVLRRAMKEQLDEIKYLKKKIRTQQIELARLKSQVDITSNRIVNFMRENKRLLESNKSLTARLHATIGIRESKFERCDEI